MSTQQGKTGPRYDLAAHLELARAFPALAERLKPLLLTEIEIECPAGHKLKVIAQLVASGRAVFCPKCRRAFEPVLHPAVEVPEVFEMASPPGSAPPEARSTGDAGLAREGLARIAEGAGLLLRAAGGRLLGSLKRAAERAAGPLGSLAVHAGLLLLVMFLGIKLEVARPEPDEPLTADFAPVEKKDLVSKVKKRDIFHKIHENEQPLEVPLPELRDAIPPAPIDEIEEEKPEKLPGEPLPTDELAWMPTEIFGPRLTGPPGVLGVGRTGRPGAFALRGDRGRRLEAARRGGGGPDTEGAVEMALEWLARNQERDGSWSLDGKGRAAAAGRWWAARARQMRPAMTGFATLAFLGAGYTPKAGKYKENVDRAQNWLLALLKKAAREGQPGTFNPCMYTQGMATLAIAEAYGMTRDPAVKPLAQAAVDVIVAAQGPYEAWTYRTKKGKAGRNDTSVTGWNLMALKSAKIAGLRVDGAAFQGCMRWLEAATDPANGKCSYAGNIKTANKRFLRRGSGSEAMWAAGMLMRQFMGAPKNDPSLLKAAATIGQKPPKWDVTTIPARKIPARTTPARTIPARTIPEIKIPARTIGGKHYPARTIPARTIPARTTPARTIPARSTSREINFYYWYYATLCMFQMGDDHWKAWNTHMKKALLGNQRKGGPMDGSKADVDGSWDSVGGGSVPYGGRVFSTALGALTLEVYYRYLPLYTK